MVRRNRVEIIAELLREMSLNGGRSMTTLMYGSGLTHKLIVEYLEKLQRKGFVERVPGLSDGRVSAVYRASERGLLLLKLIEKLGEVWGGDELCSWNLTAKRRSESVATRR